DRGARIRESRGRPSVPAPSERSLVMRTFCLLLLAVALGAAPASAQFREQAPEKSGLGFTANATFNQMSGTIGDSIGTGLGAALQAFYDLPEQPARLGAGLSYTRFSTDGPGDGLNKLSFFARGSVHIHDPNTSVVPYAQGTVGYTMLDDDEGFCTDREAPDPCPPDDLLVGREWSGFELGAVVGVDIPLTETLNIDVVGTFSWAALGDVTAGGLEIADTSTNISTFGLRAGVTVFPR
ncbi:MAG: hypothetical protein ACODAB_06325, partial [Gemmatimonadota bacterium]